MTSNFCERDGFYTPGLEIKQEGYPVFGNIYDQNPKLNGLLKGVVRRFDRASLKSGKVLEVDIAGLLATGKSTFARGLIKYLDRKMFVRFQDSEKRPLVLFYDWGQSVRITQEMPDGVREQIGSITAAGYEEIRATDQEIVAVTEDLGRNVILVREKIMLGQNFDKNWNVIGASRGDIGDVRTAVGNGREVYIAMLWASEEERLKRLERREQRGGLNMEYSGHNLFQHTQSVAEVISSLTSQGVMDVIRNPESYVDVFRLFQEKPQAFRDIVERGLFPRLVEGIYGSKQTEGSNKAVLLINPELEDSEVPEDERNGLENLLKERNLVDVLRHEAQTKGKARIRRTLERYNLI